ncbi:hypothetical protein HEP73_04246 [Xanthomonas sp. GW]|uniref:hypothetical protein n=1 Tax=Xanthomonas sp. GW TaxID=2724121 RepID=UPI00163AA0C4|nr:hypothetical protein [Xanthomonas sp. GW]QNH23293.1 hypothetical protein HEP73_04246 [Xanthomonas sp. GW]
MQCGQRGCALPDNSSQAVENAAALHCGEKMACATMPIAARALRVSVFDFLVLCAGMRRFADAIDDALQATRTMVPAACAARAFLSLRPRSFL